MSEDNMPLRGLVVVELSTSVAGPFAGQILADLGAEVFKVENPQGGDDARSWGPPFVEGVSPTFQALNRNKHSLAVDLKDECDRLALATFIEDRVDIVVQNLRPGLIERYALDAKTLRVRKPELIYCNISAYGATGPKRTQPGYDPLMQAYGGIMSTTGVEGESPVRVGPSLVDQGAGMWSAIAIQSALVARMRSGQGCTIDTSLYETALVWLQPQIANYLASGKVPLRLGTENANIAPYKAFKASDGWLVIAAGNDNIFARFCRTLGRESWAQDARFKSNPARVENRAELNHLIQSIIETDRRDTWIEQLERAGVPTAPMLSIDEVLKEPQFRDLGILRDVPKSGLPVLGLPVSFNGARPNIRSASPALGESTNVLSAYQNGGAGQGRHGAK